MIIWKDIIYKEMQKYYFKRIINFIRKEKLRGKKIYPKSKDVFNAFRFTELKATKVVIIGQDPYFLPNQANGLSFSVNINIPIPVSLLNIYKELSNDILGFNIPKHGFLKKWADQGVLLLNSILTVEEGKAKSHSKLGWETFTDTIIKVINLYKNGIVFLLWGTHAQKKESIIDTNRHFILKSSHPSPLSAHLGFIGCRHFSKTNQFLIKQNKTPIDWGAISEI